MKTNALREALGEVKALTEALTGSSDEKAKAKSIGLLRYAVAKATVILLEGKEDRSGSDRRQTVGTKAIKASNKRKGRILSNGYVLPLTKGEKIGKDWKIVALENVDPSLIIKENK